jgi:hypothetical protein
VESHCGAAVNAGSESVAGMAKERGPAQGVRVYESKGRDVTLMGRNSRIRELKYGPHVREAFLAPNIVPKVHGTGVSYGRREPEGLV